MKMEEIRKMSVADLNKNILKLRKELRQMKFDSSTGQTNTSHLVKIKKTDIARMMMQLGVIAREGENVLVEKEVKEEKEKAVK